MEVTVKIGDQEVNTTIIYEADTHMGTSMYGFKFDETCPAWTNNREYNLMFLRCQQNYANDRLKAKGKVYLNEVHEMLGAPCTPEGQLCGWIYDPNDPNRDSYIDLDIDNERNSEGTTFILDPNVDGIVWGYL